MDEERKARKLLVKLIGKPYFPILFSSEGVKLLYFNAIEYLTTGSADWYQVIGAIVVAVLSTVVWIFADTDIDYCGYTDK